MTTPVFVPLVGQFENIGDIMLRRQLVAWLARSGRPLQVLVGAAPASFVAALELPGGSTVHTSFGEWSAAILRAPRGAGYVYKPGEIQTTVKGLREHVGLLPLVARLHARGGTVLRVGAGVRHARPPFVALMRPSARLPHLTYWRDQLTRDAFGLGQVMPDLAFAEGAADGPVAGEPARDLLTVSFRGDREALPAGYVAALGLAAREHGLRVAVVTQVRRDAEAAHALAEAMGAEEHRWDAQPELEQERGVREVFARSAAVVSDRLHVLIAATTEGAAPVGVVPSGHEKLARHFGAAGIDLRAARFDPADPAGSSVLVAAVGAAVANRAGVVGQLAQARTRLVAVRDEVVASLVPAA